MPQQQSSAAQPKQKRPYRKGNPLSGTERQLASIARKRNHQKEIKVFVDPDVKAILMDMCKEQGVSQAVVLERLIKAHAENKK
ncbi:replication regulatory protein RepA [Erwinia typographi]|uniref:replication regulatory protein RepA n=1 Tax=Erwinia typographi TaxID=371042 RepID=UPI000907870F|nr:replication regulatory protein RepA [Erwinia typographi]